MLTLQTSGATLIEKSDKKLRDMNLDIQPTTPTHFLKLRVHSNLFERKSVVTTQLIITVKILYFNLCSTRF